MTGSPGCGAPSCTSGSARRSSTLTGTARHGPAELAHHFTAAAPVDGPRRAIEYSLLAGRAALAALDYDEAEARFSAALELGIDDPRRHVETQLELGTARFRGGRSDGAIEAFADAVRIAREIGDARMLATAAVGFEEACWRPAITDRGAVELLEEASTGARRRGLRAAGDAAGRPRARPRVPRGTSRPAVVAEQSAIAMARRLDDRFGLATVLMRSYWSRGERNLEHTLEMLSEARDLAEELGETDMQAEAVEWRIAGLIVLGELTTAERELAEVLELAVRLRQPFTVHVAEHDASMLALCFGRLVDAEAAALRSHEWSRLLTGRDASGTYGIQMFGIRREQGRLAELAPAIRGVASGGQAQRRLAPGLAALLAELGMKDQARRELARVAPRDSTRCAPSSGWRRSRISPTPAPRWATTRWRRWCIRSSPRSPVATS